MRNRSIEELKRIAKEFEDKLPKDTVLRVELSEYYRDYHIYHGDVVIAGELDENDLQNETTLKNILAIDKLLKEDFDGWKVETETNGFLMLVLTGVEFDMYDSGFDCTLEKDGYHLRGMRWCYRNLDKKKDRERWERGDFAELIRKYTDWKELNEKYERFSQGASARLPSDNINV